MAGKSVNTMRKFLQKLIGRRDILLITMSLLTSVLLYWYYAPGDQEVTETEGPQVVLPAGERVQENTPPKNIPNAGAPVRFLMMNVRNYFVEGDEQRSQYKRYIKSVRERDAVADVIAEAKPEIVGLVEMGGRAAVHDLVQRLESHGLRYPYWRVLERMREDRALAVLSRHPIVEDHSVKDCEIVGQKDFYMLRGILDVTVRTEDGRYFRIMGVHLKSKVSDNPAASDFLRANEARTLAAHVLHATQSEPNMPILVYGDWNAGPSESSLSIIAQGIAKESALHCLVPTDERGDIWTIYFKKGGVYSTFDRMYVNAVLKKRMGRRARMGIIGGEKVRAASDHRALWCELK